MIKPKTCCIVVYGCAKNEADAEEMAARLEAAGYSLTSDASEADVVVVHTCGFVEDAKRESIEGILTACQTVREKRTPLRAGRLPVVVTGCLSQRYAHDLMEEIPELAGVAGTSAPRDIVQIVERVLSGERFVHVGSPGRGAPGEGMARLTGKKAREWAYIRVSEGCRHRCTYCAIPLMRGPLASRSPEDIIREAQALADSGAKEVNLIAQDLGDYGFDFAGRTCLPELVRRLCLVEGLEWIRLLYLRPDGVTGELASAMAHPKVVPYVDLPVEHGSPRILRLMGRPGPERILRAVETLRASVPDLYIRTTVIAGFPGETEQDVEETKALLKAIRVHRVGVFRYSPEEGTPAFSLPRAVPAEAALERTEELRKFGLALARQNSQSMVGKEIPVLLSRPGPRPGYWLGRGPHQAPEVDGWTYVKGASDPARIVRAHVRRAGTLDLFASAV